MHVLSTCYDVLRDEKNSGITLIKRRRDLHASIMSPPLYKFEVTALS